MARGTSYLFGSAGEKWLRSSRDVREMAHGRRCAAQAGFTYWATVPGGGGTYRDPVFVHNGVKKQVQKFKTDAVGDFALDFLDKQIGEQPFYLLVPFYAPAYPLRLSAGRIPALVQRFEVFLFSKSSAKSLAKPKPKPDVRQA